MTASYDTMFAYKFRASLSIGVFLELASLLSSHHFTPFCLLFLFSLACLSPVSTSMIHLHVFVLYTFNCIVSHRRKVLKRQFFDTTGTGSLSVRKIGIEGNLWTAISVLFLSRRAQMYGNCLFGYYKQDEEEDGPISCVEEGCTFRRLGLALRYLLLLLSR